VSFSSFPSTLRFFCEVGIPTTEDFCFRAPSKKGVVGCISVRANFNIIY
jgi:hypothetical protein